jgi:ABC-type branched-subunit amino acid transport system substrate-binding protein
MKRLNTAMVTLALSAIVAIATQTPAAASKAKIGILLPLTGPFSAVAETQKQGALFAAEVINKRGGRINSSSLR